MNIKSINCPDCGQPAAGKFCSHCGAAVTTQAAAKQWNAQTIVPWVAIGIATIALVVALASLIDGYMRANKPAPFAYSSSSPLPVPASAQSIDLSSMTPRQAADRLFNRVMTANERGDSTEALRFVPMAIQAYERIGVLDNDARYHVALIHMAAGDTNSARVQLAALRQSAPKHLLAFMLEHQIAEQGGNKAGTAQAYKTFLAAHAAEIATVRSEYQDHLSQIERFRTAAQAAMAGKK